MQVRKLIIQNTPKMPYLLDLNQLFGRALSTFVAFSKKLSLIVIRFPLMPKGVLLSY